MKKWIAGLMTCVLMFAGTVFCPREVIAGEINSAEQSIISAVSATYTIGNGVYAVTEEYRQSVAEYLSRDDINMTEAQVNHYLSLFYSNLSAGIQRGYLVKISDVSGSTEGTAGSEEVAAEPEGAEESDSAGTDESGNTGGSTKDEVSVKVSPMDATMYVYGARILNVRAAASVGSEILGTLEEGAKVIVTGATDNGWLRIEYEGKDAYVSAAYLRLRADLENDPDELNEEVQEIIDVVQEHGGVESVLEDTEKVYEIKDDTEIEALEEADSEEKDYSDAGAVSKNIEFEKIAVLIALAAVIAAAVIIAIHKKKKRHE